MRALTRFAAHHSNGVPAWLPAIALGLAACPAGKGDDSAASDAVCACDEAPVADARGDGSPSPGATYTLDGSGSAVCDGGPPTCTWTVESVPSDSTIDTGDLDTGDSCTASFVPDAVGAYVIGLAVTDACGTVSATDLVVLNVTSSSGAPVARCTLAGDAIVGQPTFVDGSGSTDWEGAALTYSWTFGSVPSCSVLTASDLHNADAVTTWFIPDCAAVYMVALAVSDGEESSMAYCSITASDP